MTPRTTTLPTTPLGRWQRQRMAIRCALYPDQPALIRCHLGLGRRLAREDVLPDVQVQQRMLKLLLDTALDEALPGFWRSVCLEHAVWPLARIQSMLALHDPVAAQAWQAAVQMARDRLPLAPR